MKVGETFEVPLYEIAKPLVNRIAYVCVDGSDMTTVRIIDVREDNTAVLKVLPVDTKD